MLDVAGIAVVDVGRGLSPFAIRRPSRHSLPWGEYS